MLRKHEVGTEQHTRRHKVVFIQHSSQQRSDAVRSFSSDLVHNSSFPLSPPPCAPPVPAGHPFSLDIFWACGRISVAAKVVCVIDTIVAVSTVAVLWTGSVPAYSRPYLILMVTHR